MPSRRWFCLGVVFTLGGCFEQSQPLPDNPPPIETEYLPEQNVVRLWHVGSDASTEIEELLLRVQPRSGDTGGGDPASYGALLERPDGTAHQGVWVSTEAHSIAEYPLEPGAEIYVTGYETSGQELELESGDEITLIAYYPDDHGVVHFRGFTSVP